MEGRKDADIGAARASDVVGQGEPCAQINLLDAPEGA